MILKNTGTITALAGTVQIDTAGLPGVSVVLSGTWVASLIAELSGDNGVTWDQTDLFLRSVGTVQFAVGANGFYTLSWGGGAVTNARIRANTFTSGTVNVRLIAAPYPMVLAETSSQGAGGAVPANAKQMGLQAPNNTTIYARANALGYLINLPHALPGDFISGSPAAITDTSAVTLIDPQGAGVRAYITSMTITNSHATVGTVIEISTGGGTVILWRGFVKATGDAPINVVFPTPLRSGDNQAILAAALTTGSNVFVTASGYKAAN